MSNIEYDLTWYSPRLGIPQPFESVLVYIPSQAPFPTVREGYIIADDNGIPQGWFVPGLREGYDVYDVVKAWAYMPEPQEKDWL